MTEKSIKQAIGILEGCYFSARGIRARAILFNAQKWVETLRYWNDNKRHAWLR